MRNYSRSLPCRPPVSMHPMQHTTDNMHAHISMPTLCFFRPFTRPFGVPAFRGAPVAPSFHEIRRRPYRMHGRSALPVSLQSAGQRAHLGTGHGQQSS